jgi:hypothetical protein
MLKYRRSRCAHAVGDGTVNSVNEYHTVIDFDAHGVRTFASPPCCARSVIDTGACQTGQSRTASETSFCHNVVAGHTLSSSTNRPGGSYVW